VATYLATVVLQQMVAQLAHASSAGEDVNKWINDIATEFAASSWALLTAYELLRDTFVTAIAFPLTDLVAIRDDTTWWNQVKCCFYNNINGNSRQYFTQADVDAIATCVGFTPYPAHPWVPTMIGNLIHNLGFDFWNAVQVGAALDVGDCSGCSAWCRKLDFRAGPQGYSAVVGGTWISGVGWRGTYVPADGAMSIHISDFSSPWPTGGSLERIDITWGADGPTGATNPELGRDMAVFNGATFVQGVTITPNTAQTLITQTYSFPPVTATNVSIVIGQNSSGSGVVVVQDITFRGPGANPFGADNCV
jgi:hypothetical protein